MTKGTDFEIKTCEFLKALFTELNFLVIEARQQKTGTQNGFDVLIKFIDEYDKERNFHFECKDYATPLNWEKILVKLHELAATGYHVDGFFAVSPKIDISNIHHHLANDLPNKVKFPVRHWTPESCINEYFALAPEIYQVIYGELTPAINRDHTLKKIKAVITTVLDEKDALTYAGVIDIKETAKAPKEDSELKTTLDRKLNSVLKGDDSRREMYHQQRCDYKIYLEELQDVNNQLRSKIINWQNNMRIRADRLTQKFETHEDYTAVKFFHDFFSTAETHLLSFLEANKLNGDYQKLLHGVIFELAAECKLNWSAPKVSAPKVEV